MLRTTVLLVWLASAALAACPNGQWRINDGNCYWSSVASSSWSQARVACQSEDPRAELVSIHSYEEQLFVTSLTSANNIWIGFNDLNVLGEFVWTDQSEVDFVQWGGGEPDTQNRCVWSNSYAWYTVPCTEQSAFVCKIIGAA